MNDFAFDNLNRLSWLAMAAVACALMFYGFAMKRRALRAFSSADMLALLAPNVSWGRQYFKAILVFLAMIAIVLALIGPRWGRYYEDVQQRQLDLMICLDVSKSMLAEDAGMSRMDRAKDDIKRLVDTLDGGTVGLITFAGGAELACPLTDDYEFYRLTLEDVGIHSAPVGGTNLGDALATARKAFGGPGPRDRAILLITDGEDHGGTAVDEAGNAHDEGILVYTIGVGDQGDGAPIPVQKDGHRTILKYKGRQIWSKMDPYKLRMIAQAGGGDYSPSVRWAGTHQRMLEWSYPRLIAPFNRQAEAKRQVERRHVLFHWFAIAALVLLMIETLVREARPAARHHMGVSSASS